MLADEALAVGGGTLTRGDPIVAETHIGEPNVQEPSCSSTARLNGSTAGGGTLEKAEALEAGGLAGAGGFE